MIYNVKEHLNLYGELGIIVGSAFQSLINGSDETSGFESLRLSRVSWIANRLSRSRHVACEEVTRETLTV